MSDQQISGIRNGNTNNINVQIISNPAPRVVWHVDDYKVPEGTQNGRYESQHPEHVGNDKYNVTLHINNFNQGDTNKIYNLKAENPLGITEYIIHLNGLDDGTEVTGLEMSSIIGIVVGAILLAILAVGVLTLAAKRKWCFGGKYLAYWKYSGVLSFEGQ